MSEESQLLDRVRRAIRLRSLSRKTENAYLNHIRRFQRFYETRDLAEMDADEIRAFLNYLEAEGHYAVSTQNQALCALTFLYRDVFGREMSSRFKQIARARPPDKFPDIYTPEEAKAVLSQMKDASFLAAALIYGAGLRLAEALNLRVGDICFERGEIIVRDLATGAKDRASILPKSLVAALQRHLREVKFMHEDDCLRGYGAVFLPPSIARSYAGAERDWHWQYIFPACKLTAANGGGLYRRHLAESTVQKAINEAARTARVSKKGGCQTLRYSFAVRLFERNTNVRMIQNLLGHKNLKTTMNYISFFGSGKRVQSPLDY